MAKSEWIYDKNQDPIIIQPQKVATLETHG